MCFQFNLIPILGFAILILQVTQNAPVVAQSKISFATCEEIEVYAIDVAETISKTALDILSIPSDQRTFENTIIPWNRLSARLSGQLDVLYAHSNLDYPLSVVASQFANELYAYFLEVAQYPELRQCLIRGSLNKAQNPELDPFRNYIGTWFEILLARSHRDSDRGGSSCEGGITGKWGDGNGIQWEGYVKAEAHDGKGNYAEGRITQKDDGKGEVEVRGGHESKNK